MTLLGLFVLVIVFMLMMWLIDQMPGDVNTKRIVKVLLAIIVVIYLLSGIGLLGTRVVF